MNVSLEESALSTFGFSNPPSPPSTSSSPLGDVQPRPRKALFTPAFSSRLLSRSLSMGSVGSLSRRAGLLSSGLFQRKKKSLLGQPHTANTSSPNATGKGFAPPEKRKRGRPKTKLQGPQNSNGRIAAPRPQPPPHEKRKPPKRKKIRIQDDYEIGKEKVISQGGPCIHYGFKVNGPFLRLFPRVRSHSFFFLPFFFGSAIRAAWNLSAEFGGRARTAPQPTTPTSARIASGSAFATASTSSTTGLTKLKRLNISTPTETTRGYPGSSPTLIP